MKIVLKMFFLKFSNADIKLAIKKLTKRSYIVTQTFFIAKQVELIDKNKFVHPALYKNFKTFVMHVDAQEIL